MFAGQVQCQAGDELTIRPEQSGLKSKLTESHISTLWRKASTLKSTASATCLQPTLSLSASTSDSKKAFIVTSFSGTAPHTVVVTAKGNVVCNCSGYSSSKICCHSLAVADKEHCLMEFLEKFGKNSVKTTNISTLANTGRNRTVSGKKGQHHKTRRRTCQGENPLCEEFPRVLDLLKTKLYTEVWQNDNPFDVVLISGNISKCASCDFPRATGPFLMILSCGIQNGMNIQTKKALDTRKSPTKNGMDIIIWILNASSSTILISTVGFFVWILRLRKSYLKSTSTI